jgi:hypothetical protein
MFQVCLLEQTGSGKASMAAHWGARVVLGYEACRRPRPHIAWQSLCLVRCAARFRDVHPEVCRLELVHSMIARLVCVCWLSRCAFREDVHGRGGAMCPCVDLAMCGCVHVWIWPYGVPRSFTCAVT